MVKIFNPRCKRVAASVIRKKWLNELDLSESVMTMDVVGDIENITDDRGEYNVSVIYDYLLDLADRFTKVDDGVEMVCYDVACELYDKLPLKDEYKVK